MFPVKSHLNALNALTHWESITTFLAVTQSLQQNPYNKAN